jgi:DNA-binding NarL/FixJ family response regulator
LLKDRLGAVEVIDLASAEDAARFVSRGRKADAVLYTVICPQSLASPTLKEVSDLLPGIPIAAHTAGVDKEHVQGLVDQGAAGLISTDVSADVAMAALKLVAAGGRYIPPDLLQRPARPSQERMSTVALRTAFGQLTRREAQVLELVAKGLSNKEVAKQLGLAEATVKIHVRSTLRKMKAKNRTQLALLAVRPLH